MDAKISQKSFSLVNKNNPIAGERSAKENWQNEIFANSCGIW